VGPPLVRLTGTVLAPGEQARREGLEVLNVRAGDKELKFKLERAENLTGERTGEELLQDLAGRRLFLRGPEKLIRPLEEPKIAGKRIRIEGSLFVSDGILDVTTIGEDAAKAG
jgi:hypothetical protein